jgi:PhnB protein
MIASPGGANSYGTIDRTDGFSVAYRKVCQQRPEILCQSLEGKELFRMPTPDGGVAHAEFMIGNTRIYISDEAAEWHAFAMPEGSMASCLFSIATDDCDGSYDRAIDAGAEALSEPQNQFWGTRSAIIKDPFGYRWSFIQRIEDVSPEDLEKRAQEYFLS